ncbi:hypothetical protein M8C21_027939 [Ambrosia artemisiifolia]|uniref:Uncharacterized protein n=1 Tax=Ambrosia artemisiifolia TaxID=4212 RepID=A0AAD5DE87_AMBAR|nr:hypothetical protein M8C21_027939 [Ambrosia artemisiifolia]
MISKEDYCAINKTG